MAISNIENITRLRGIILNELLPLIDDDFSLLDIPYHNNIGDSLIYFGELELFKQVSRFKLIYKSSARYGDINEIPNKGILLLHGGGNFGDIWHESHDFRRKIIGERPNQKIIIFPQTVFYNNLALIKRDSDVYNKHSNITICARDKQSYLTLKKYFECRIILVPDLAFLLNFNYNSLLNQDSKNLLFLQRTDLESRDSGSSIFDFIKHNYSQYKMDIFDWPGMHFDSIIKKFIMERKNRFLRRSYLILKNSKIKKFIIDPCYGLESPRKGEKLFARGVRFMNNYDVVFSNRLHGIILALLMDKNVICLDNSYGKNQSFFDTWLKEFNNCSFLII